MIVIDSGQPGKEQAIIDAIGDAGHQPAHVSDILVTHYHQDHIGSLARMAAATRARVHVHAVDSAITRSGEAAPRQSGRGVPGKIMALVLQYKGVEPAVVDNELRGGEHLDLAGGIRVVHTPGHTSGHVSYLWEAGKALICGDAAGTATGRLGPAPLAEDHVTALESFVTLSKLDFDVAAFGHGKPITTGASEAFSTAAKRLTA